MKMDTKVEFEPYVKMIGLELGNIGELDVLMTITPIT